jgi:hypothetical protein
LFTFSWTSLGDDELSEEESCDEEDDVEESSPSLKSFFFRPVVDGFILRFIVNLIVLLTEVEKCSESTGAFWRFSGEFSDWCGFQRLSAHLDPASSKQSNKSIEAA